MYRFASLILFLIVLLPYHLANADVRPSPGNGDPRFQTVQFKSNQVVQLSVAMGFGLTIAFSPTEQIENIVIGDGAGWQITPNKKGNHLFIKLLSQGMPTTNLTVITNARTYVFLLTPTFGLEPDLPLVITFIYSGQQVKADDVKTSENRQALISRYRLSGSRDLRPNQVFDDGIRTYIEFSIEQSMPAIYTENESGTEQLIDGKVRGEYFVIDAINRRLIFRLGNKTGYATRISRMRE